MDNNNCAVGDGDDGPGDLYKEIKTNTKIEERFRPKHVWNKYALSKNTSIIIRVDITFLLYNLFKCFQRVTAVFEMFKKKHIVLIINSHLLRGIIGICSDHEKCHGHKSRSKMQLSAAIWAYDT